MYCFTSSNTNQLLSHIRDAKMPNEAWENLKKIFAASTTARKLQLREELNSIRQTDMLATNMSVTDISGEEQKKKKDRGMASSLPTEKLDRSNYASWSYKMHQYLLGHGYWSYVDKANDPAPDATHRDSSAWEQAQVG